MCEVMSETRHDKAKQKRTPVSRKMKTVAEREKKSIHSRTNNGIEEIRA
jgi:hypothetical protein